MAVTSAPPAKKGERLAPTLRRVHVGVRNDLEVSRHLFRGVPSYVVSDPLTFQSQRLDLCDYQVFVSIDSACTLAKTFDSLVRRGRVFAEDEERFYEFVLSLHRLGFLRLPISDDKLLYRRYRLKRQARRREKLKGFLFLRIPVWNPDAFLERTIHLARPIFSPGFFVFWCALVGAAAFVVARHWHELAQPLQGMLAARNVPLIWLTLIILKLFHELGHAYACKHYGGHVPEMGVYLIIFTPCAYMDASASWGFTRKRQRLFVCFAGMYVEAVFASLAVFVWAATEPGLVHAVAYNVILLASVVTVLFNINPLMRFDGYYIFSDLVEIPNLRQRASQYLSNTLKRLLLGVEQAADNAGRRVHAILLGYGSAVTVYRAGLVLAIAALLSARFHMAGFVVSAFMVTSLVLGNLTRLTEYLWRSRETAGRRWRAVAISLFPLLVIPVAVLLVPVPAEVAAPAVIAAEHEAIVRTVGAGFLTETPVAVRQTVRAGDTLARLSNERIHEQIAEAKANVRTSEIRCDAMRANDPSRCRQEEVLLGLHRRQLRAARDRLADLTVRAPIRGYVIKAPTETPVGTYLQEGTPIAKIVSGGWLARAVLTEDQFARASPEVGDLVEFRSAGDAGSVARGTVQRVLPAGSRTINPLDFEALTHLAGGEIAIDPQTQSAGQPYFQVDIKLLEESPLPNPPDIQRLRHGRTGVVRFAAAAEPLGHRLGRRFARFWNRLRGGSLGS